MIEPAEYDEKRTPSVLWAGKRWPIPPLVADQLDAIWDDVIELTSVLDDQERQKAKPLPDDAFAGLSEEKRRELAFGKALSDRVFSLTGEEYKRLREVVYYGLTRAHPALTRDRFRNAPTTPYEMLIAFWEVRRQSGMYGPVRSGDPNPGEAAATDGKNQTSNS